MPNDKYVILVKDMDGKTVKKVECEWSSSRRHEAVMSGMLRNMSPSYYVDDSDADRFYESSGKE